ncbi:MAG: ATP-binding protein [Gammaproteobacteria bacterium]|nr:ATP-binding protein [Gammaproteobacteria bacterium]
MSQVHQALKRLLLEHGERGEPIAFAGREEVLGAIAEIADSLRGRPIEGQTFVIGGAPGAGKTSLVRESARRLRGQGVAAAICPSPSSDGDIDALVWRIVAALTGETKDKLQGTHRKRFSGSVSMADLGGVSGSYESERKEPALRSFDDISLLTAKLPVNPVVVFIDEAQNIQNDSKAAALVNTLHTQFELPVLLVCAGLANTYDRLHQVGLTRPAEDHVVTLGVLKREEAQAAVQQALGVIAGTGVAHDESKIEALVEAISTAADGWPRHLTCYLHAICEVLIEQSSPDFSQVDLDVMLARGHQLRERYYENRLVLSELPTSIIAHLYRQMQARPLHRNACEDVLEAAIHGQTYPGHMALQRRFPTGKDAFETVLRAGLLTLHGFEPCRIPIPSMETFVLGKAGADN